MRVVWWTLARWERLTEIWGVSTPGLVPPSPTSGFLVCQGFLVVFPPPFALEIGDCKTPTPELLAFVPAVCGQADLWIPSVFSSCILNILTSMSQEPLAKLTPFF